MALGDILYRGSSVWKRLVGNITIAPQMLVQTGDGVNSAAPGWSDVILFRQRSVLTNAQVIALPTTKVKVITAPGSLVVARRIRVLGMSVYAITPTAYTNL